MKKIAWTFPVLAGIMWGSVGIFIRALNGYGMNTFTIVESRTVTAVVLMAVGIFFYDRSQMKIHLKDLWIFVLASWLGMFGVNLTYNEAVNYVHLSLAAVLLSLSPVYVLIMARIFFKEKITVRKAGCAALAILGCAMASGLLESLGGMKMSPYGVVLAFASGVFYAMYSMFTKIAMKRGYSGLTITFYCMVVIALTLIPMTDWKIIGTYISEAPVGNSVFMILHAVCAAVLPYTLYTIGFQYMDAGKVSILAAGEPVAAMVFGIFCFSEIPTTVEFAGLFLTVAAIILLECRKKAALPERRNRQRHNFCCCDQLRFFQRIWTTGLRKDMLYCKRQVVPDIRYVDALYQMAKEAYIYDRCK